MDFIYPHKGNLKKTDLNRHTNIHNILSYTLTNTQQRDYRDRFIYSSISNLSLFIHHTAKPSLFCCISMETNRLLSTGVQLVTGHHGWKRFWSQSGWDPGTERASVACGEYVMVPPGLVTAVCVFPFISSENLPHYGPEHRLHKQWGRN